MQMSSEDVVSFYQQLGFLQSQTPDILLAQYQRVMGDAFDAGRPWDDAYLLSLDEERVWTDDPECDVCAENGVYCEVIPEWSRLASGIFAPDDIEEVWESETGPITVRFTLDAARHSIQPDYLNDYLDLSILTKINSLISLKGRQFACASDVNFAVVFLIDTAVRQRLEEYRHFPFLF